MINNINYNRYEKNKQAYHHHPYFDSFFAVGCIDRYKSKVLTNYVTAYIINGEFQLVKDRDNSTYVINFWESSEYAAFNSKGDRLDKFKELSIKNGDTSYNEIIELYLPCDYRRRMFFDKQISQITIMCDKDIDDRHPAGSSLNDLFLLFTGSPDKFIKNNYQPLDINKDAFLKNINNNLKMHIEPFFYGKMTSEPIYGRISDIDFSKYNLIGGIYPFTFGFLVG